MSDWARRALETLDDRARLRRLRAVSPIGPCRVRLEGRTVRLFSSNDYLGLSTHREVRRALADAAREHGVGPRGAALICGFTDVHEALEDALATLKGTEAALVFPTGYQANVGLLSALGTAETTLFSDALNHASIIDGCRLARARVKVYRHRDLDDLEAQLRATDGPKIVVTDEVFSMDGVGAPLAELAALKARYGFTLVTDSAHSTLVYGPRGAGWAAACGVADAVDFQVGTLSKAVGAHGGFVACSGRHREWLLNTGRAFIFSTALPLPLAAAARAALEVAAAEPSLRTRLWSHAERVWGALSGDPALGTPAPDASVEAAANSAPDPDGAVGLDRGPIVPVILGAESTAVAASARLLEAGFHVPAIRPPTVPEGTCRLRIALSAAHAMPDVDALVTALRERLD